MSQAGCRCDRFCYIRGMNKRKKKKLLESIEVAKGLLKNFIDNVLRFAQRHERMGTWWMEPQGKVHAGPSRKGCR